MPVKAKNKPNNIDENSLLAQLGRDDGVALPNGLKQKYSAGRVIGDGAYLEIGKNLF